MKKKINYDCFTVNGGSMLPIIKPNQKVKIVKTKDVKIGDIIIFKNKNEFIVHRIVKKNKKYIITKGDHSSLDRFPIGYKNILGKVIKIGNKRIDNSYYNLINPFIAKLSYYSIKIDPRSYSIYNYLRTFKNKITNNKILFIKHFLNVPHIINYKIFKILKK